MTFELKNLPKLTIDHLEEFIKFRRKDKNYYLNDFGSKKFLLLNDLILYKFISFNLEDSSKIELTFKGAELMNQLGYRFDPLAKKVYSL